MYAVIQQSPKTVFLFNTLQQAIAFCDFWKAETGDQYELDNVIDRR